MKTCLLNKSGYILQIIFLPSNSFTNPLVNAAIPALADAYAAAPGFLHHTQPER